MTTQGTSLEASDSRLILAMGHKFGSDLTCNGSGCGCDFELHQETRIPCNSDKNVFRSSEPEMTKSLALALRLYRTYHAHNRRKSVRAVGDHFGYSGNEAAAAYSRAKRYAERQSEEGVA